MRSVHHELQLTFLELLAELRDLRALGFGDLFEMAGLLLPLRALGFDFFEAMRENEDAVDANATDMNTVEDASVVPDAGAAIAAAPIADIYVIGRRGAEHASFTNNELAEMGRLMRAVSVADASVLEAVAPASDPTPEKLRKTKNNYEFLVQVSKTAPGGVDAD